MASLLPPDEAEPRRSGVRRGGCPGGRGTGGSQGRPAADHAQDARRPRRRLRGAGEGRTAGASAASSPPGSPRDVPRSPRRPRARSRISPAAWARSASSFPGDAAGTASARPSAAPVGDDPRPAVRQPRLPRRDGGGRGQGSYRLFLGHGPAAPPPSRSRSTARPSASRRRGREPIRPAEAGHLVRTCNWPSTWSPGPTPGPSASPGDLTEFSGKAFAPGWDGTIDHILVDGRGDGRGPQAGARRGQPGRRGRSDPAARTASARGPRRGRPRRTPPRPSDGMRR